MQTIPLQPKTMAVLRYLVERAGQLVPKAVLFDAVWPETAVSDNVLMVCLALHGQCVERPLTLLNERAIEPYLAARFPGDRSPMVWRTLCTGAPTAIHCS
jgi:hypothetical protein